MQGRNLVEPLLPLLNDDAPLVRLYAMRAAENNWDARFGEPVRNRFRDTYQEIRSEAVGCLSIPGRGGPKEAYLELLKEPEPNVKMCALSVLLRLDREAIPAEPLVEMIRDPRPEVQASVLNILWQMNHDVVPRADLLPLLGSFRFASGHHSLEAY